GLFHALSRRPEEAGGASTRATRPCFPARSQAGIDPPAGTGRYSGAAASRERHLCAAMRVLQGIAGVALSQPTSCGRSTLPRQRRGVIPDTGRARSTTIARTDPAEETAMPFYERGNARIHYKEAGSGFPLFIISGGGLDSK